ncbi:Inorganic diphosphatase [Bertholletia excelsa]
MTGIVVVFDFDKTIIDLDSDNWLLDELGFTELFSQLLPTMPWNSLMDKMMEEIHSQGKTIDDIVEVLKRTPTHPRIVPTIEAASASGCDLRIVSDANLFFIETILEHLGLRDRFSEIYTNPSYPDENGRLRIFPCHDFHSSPHGCDLCPPNMCKGRIIAKLQSSSSLEGKKMIYLGDGSGDFCPSLKLREGDIVMPRKHYPIWDLICKNREHVKAEIHEWIDGGDLEGVLLRLIKVIPTEEGGKMFSVD